MAATSSGREQFRRYGRSAAAPRGGRSGPFPGRRRRVPGHRLGACRGGGLGHRCRRGHDAVRGRRIDLRVLRRLRAARARRAADAPVIEARKVGHAWVAYGWDRAAAEPAVARAMQRRSRRRRPTSTRAAAPPDMLVLHYTGMRPARRRWRGCAIPRPRSRPTTWSRRTAASSAWCPRSAAPGTPACRSGRARPTSTRASIGIEIVNPGHEFGYRAFPEAQIAAVIDAGRRHPRALDHRRRPHRRPLRRGARPQGRPRRAVPLEAAGRGRPRPLGRAAARAGRAAGARARRAPGVFALQAGLHPAGLRLRAVRQVRRGTPPPWSAPSSGTGGPDDGRRHRRRRDPRAADGAAQARVDQDGDRNALAGTCPSRTASKPDSRRRRVICSFPRDGGRPETGRRTMRVRYRRLRDEAWLQA